MDGPAEDEHRFTIGELAERADVTPRTIRFYVAEGLLPAPGGAGQHRVYTWEHYLRLQLVKRLKAAYLPLGEIRARLEHLSVAELEALLDATPDAPPAPGSALDYIAGIVGSPSPSPRSAPPAGQPFPAPAPVPPPMVVRAPAPAFPGEDEVVRESVPTAEAAPEPPAGPASRPAGGIWRRVPLAPGVELHYQPSSDTGWEARVARLIKAAARLLGGRDSDPDPPDTRRA